VRRRLRYLTEAEWYYLPIALNIKDVEVDNLAQELARRMGHGNKTRAIRDALRAQLALLESRDGNKEARLLEVVRTEIWPLLPNAAPITKQDREAILGYDSDTGV
jgi:antitoxin VapB